MKNFLRFAGVLIFVLAVYIAYLMAPRFFEDRAEGLGYILGAAFAAWLYTTTIGILIFLLRRHKIFAVSLIFLFTTILTIGVLESEKNETEQTRKPHHLAALKSDPIDKWLNIRQEETTESYHVLTARYNEIADKIMNPQSNNASERRVLKEMLVQFTRDLEQLRAHTVQLWNKEKKILNKTRAIGVNSDQFTPDAISDKIDSGIAAWTELFNNKKEMVSVLNQILSFFVMRDGYYRINEDGHFEFEYDFDLINYQKLAERYNTCIIYENNFLGYSDE